MSTSRRNQTLDWYVTKGKDLIADKVKLYEGKGIGKIYLSNLDIDTASVDYRELVKVIDACPANYVSFGNNYDILLDVDSVVKEVQ